MSTTNTKNSRRASRHNRVRAKVKGTAQRLRVAVYKSNQFIYAQVIDDATGTTIVSASDMAAKSGTKTERAQAVGVEVAKLAMAKGIKSVIFDRNGFKYTGRIKALADSARNGGLQF